MEERSQPRYSRRFVPHREPPKVGFEALLCLLHPKKHVERGITVRETNAFKHKLPCTKSFFEIHDTAGAANAKFVIGAMMSTIVHVLVPCCGCFCFSAILRCQLRLWFQVHQTRCSKHFAAVCPFGSSYRNDDPQQNDRCTKNRA